MISNREKKNPLNSRHCFLTFYENNFTDSKESYFKPKKITQEEYTESLINGAREGL